MIQNVHIWKRRKLRFRSVLSYANFDRRWGRAKRREKTLAAKTKGRRKRRKYETMYEILFRRPRSAINSNLDSHHEIPWEIGPLTPLSTRGHFLTCETYSAIYPGNRNRNSHPMRWWSKMRKNDPKLTIITLLLCEKVTISPSTRQQMNYYELRIIMKEIFIHPIRDERV